MSNTVDKNIQQLSNYRNVLEQGRSGDIPAELKKNKIAIAQSGTEYRLAFRDSSGTFHDVANLTDLNGVSGVSGYSGKSGIRGYSGYSGISGRGASGYSGDSGFSGYSGESGHSGYSGCSGYSGLSGYSGYSGMSSGLRLWFDSSNSDLTTPVTIGTDISFINASPALIKKDSGGLIADGWKALQKISVIGSNDNDGIYEIRYVSDTTLSLCKNSTLINENVGAKVTLTIKNCNLLQTPSTGSEILGLVSVSNSDPEGIPVNSGISFVGSPGQSFIPAGLWTFSSWFYVDSIYGNTRVYAKYEVCKRDIVGVTTTLFTTNLSSEITATTIGTAQNKVITYAVESNIPILITDRIIVRVLAINTESASRVLYWIYQGASKASYVDTTFSATGVSGFSGISGYSGYSGRIPSYFQTSAPILDSDGQCAFWVDISYNNRVYLVYRRGPKDQVMTLLNL